MPTPETTPEAPPPPDPAAVAWGKTQQYLDRLFDALEQLDEAGGVVAAARAGGWSPKARKKAAASLAAAKDAIGVNCPSIGSPALLMICGRRRSIPSPAQSVSNHVLGALCC